MPCYHPLQASFSLGDDGKKSLKFGSLANKAGEAFDQGRQLSGFIDNVLKLPCGRCMGCRLEMSRQWAVRCMHEASLYEDNCFVTFTYDDCYLPADGSLQPYQLTNLFKKLRLVSKFRYFMCGEYGEHFARPHYHVCFFGLDFPDKVKWKDSNGYILYHSDYLNNLWGMGFCVIGELTFDSAAYVARYCTKKMTGEKAEEHYKGRVPEYARMSTKPGLGYDWYKRWKVDCYPSDYLIVNGVRCKVPRYYDKKLAIEDPDLLLKLKQARIERSKANEDNVSHDRLLVREKCHEARFKKLIRKIEGDLLCC